MSSTNYFVLFPFSPLHPTVTNHLPLRTAADLRNDENKFPNFSEPYSYYYNPVKQNLYSIDYTSTDIRNPDPHFWYKDNMSWKEIIRCLGSAGLPTKSPASAPSSITAPSSSPSTSPSSPPSEFITFTDIIHPGTTIVTPVTKGSPDYNPPDNYLLGEPPVYVDIVTNVSYVPPVRVCLGYPSTSFSASQSANLLLLHFESNVWKDVTTSVDTVNRIVCGTLLRPLRFVIAARNDAPPPVDDCSDLSVDVLVKPKKAFAGGFVKAKVRISNSGTRPVHDIIAKFPVPVGVTIIRISPFHPFKGRNIARNDGTIVWSKLSIPAYGRSAAIITMKIDKSFSGYLALNSSIYMPKCISKAPGQKVFFFFICLPYSHVFLYPW